MMPTQGYQTVAVSDGAPAIRGASSFKPVNVQEALLIIIIQMSWIGFHLKPQNSQNPTIRENVC